MNTDDREAALALLRWYLEMGADEAIGAEAWNRLAPPRPLPNPSPLAGEGRVGTPLSARPIVAAPPPALAESLGEAAQSARRLASGADTVDALAALVAEFDG